MQKNSLGIPIPKFLLFIMRITFFLFVIGVMQMYAVDSYAQKTHLTIHENNIKLGTLFNKIESQTDFYFFYNNDIIDKNLEVSVNETNKTIFEILDVALKDTDITYQVNNKAIILNLVKSDNLSITQTKKQVSGTVTDEEGEPIIGANIIEKGTINGTVTDYDGNFTISVDYDAVLVVSYIGYLAQEISIAGRNNIRVSLREDTQALEEVIVVGYGVQRKRDVTTSIASLRSSELATPVSSLDQAMTGKMAGVQVLQPSGIPGGGMSIKVRGTGTISAGSEPLYVIDGFPMSDGASGGAGLNVNPLSSINMNDIESIEVLKDASAAAIYGSRGANGVVIITTKRGADSKPVIQYDGYYGLQETTKKIEMMNAYQHAEINAEARNNTYLQLLDNAGISGSVEDSNAKRREKLGANPNNMRLNYIIPEHLFPYLRGEKNLTDTNWQDEVLRNANLQSHNLSIRGGSKDTKYFISANYRNEEGIVIGSGFEQIGGRAKIDTKYNKVGVGANVSYNFSNYNLVPTEDRYSNETILSTALGMLPSFPVYNEDGTFNYDQVTLNHGIPNLINPVALATLRKDNMKRNRMLGNLYIDYEIIDDLIIKTSFGVDLNSFRRNIYRPSTLPTTSNTAVLTPSNPVGTTRTKDVLNWVWENTLSYNKVINNDHILSAVTGWTAQKELIDTSLITATDYPNDLVETLNGAPITGISAFESAQQQWSLLSWLARAQYNYKNKYLFSATIRTDGSSRFGTENRWGTFPSVSGGWYVSEEDYMKNKLDWISSLKLRASWGLSGNFSIGNYEYYSTLNSDNYVFGTNETLASGLYPSNAGNPELGWEKTSMVNLGAELGLFNMITLEVDIYNSLTSDMLLSVPVPEISGYSQVLKNIGKLRNRGLELSLSSTNKLNKLIWNNKLNFSLNRNVVLDLGGVEQMITKAETMEFITQVGKPIGNYYAYVTDGVFMNQEEIDIAAKKDLSTGIAFVSGAKPGDFKYIDQNNDGVINSLDKTIVGNYMPDFTYGYSTEFIYENLDLSLSFQGVYGNKIANINRRYLNNMEGGSGQIEALNRWKSENDPGNGLVNRANRTSTGLNSQMSTWHIEDGSYLRLRNVTFGITIPEKTTEMLKMQKIRIYLSLQNPLTITKYSGYNPEVDMKGNPLTPGIDYGTYPLSKSFVLGLNILF